MGKKDDPTKWEDSSEWDRGLQRMGAVKIRQTGSHAIYELITAAGRFIFLVAIHPGSIPHPIRRKLAKTLQASGVLGILLWAFWPNVGQFVMPVIKLVGLV